MKQLLVLLESKVDLAQWIIDFRDWLKEYYPWNVIVFVIFVVFLFIENRRTKKKAEKSEYDYIHCDGLIERDTMITRRKNVLVRIHKETKAYHFKDLDGKWYLLEGKEVKEIKDSKGTPKKFTIPLRDKKDA